MIYIDSQFVRCDLPTKEQAEYILDIVRFFFPSELNRAEKSKKNALAFTRKHIGKPHRIKTILHQVPIFAYTYKDSNDFLLEIFEYALAGLVGMPDLFEHEEDVIEEVPPFTIGRNIAELRQIFCLTKQELHVLSFFMIKLQIVSGEKSPPHTSLIS